MEKIPIEAKLKHLEFIQNIITRMNLNSFSIKKWTVTLITIIITIASSINNDNTNKVLLLPYLLIALFWVLDGFFLYQERLFRGLYNDVATKNNDIEIDFSMDIRKYNPKNNLCKNKKKFKKNTWKSSTLSITLGIFYGLLIFLNTIIFIILAID